MNESIRTHDDERLERALHELPRAKPAHDLSARIIAQLPQAETARAQPRYLRALTAALALCGLVLAYQTAFDLSARGALDLMSYYAAQPAIVTLYPLEAFGALAQAIPWLMLVSSATVLSIALVLVYRLTAQPRTSDLRGA